MAKFNLLVILILIALLTGFSNAATYYVDNVYGKDSNSGTSTSSPWKNISKVNSFSFKPGDKILFKRGSTWKETLKIKRNGNSDNPIIYASYGTGSLPVINGSYSREHGIYMDGKYYIIIKEFSIKNTTHGAIRIKRSKKVNVTHNEIYITGRAGIFIEESDDCVVAKNKLTTPSTYYDEQTDGIYAQRNSNNTYDGNNIIISNQHRSQHCDAIQTFLETSAVIKNNYVEQKNTKTGKSHGIYCSQNYGTFKIFNNICYGMYTTSSILKFKNTSTSGKVQMIGNTIYGGKGGLVQTNDPYIIFKNNIVVTTGSNAVIMFEKSISSRSNINYNLYKRGGSGSNLIYYKGYYYTFSKWKSAGFDKYSVEKDPRFVSASSKDFTLQPVSPALNKGVTLDFPYDQDRLGTERPFGGRSDIGAYEMEIILKASTDGQRTASLEQDLPEVFDLTQNYPNPFNPSTTIRFSLPENSIVTLKVYDITGSEIAVLLNELKNAGIHQVTFDASNLASGTYIYTLTAKDFVQTKKMIVLK